jgi:dTMP kinase
MSTPRGQFIVFEGLDGAGTTTQLRLLADWLTDRDVPVEATREPSDGPFGSVIRQAIEGRVRLDPVALALAFAGDRADHLSNEVNGIEQALGRGSWVLCDRYVLSSLAYQASTDVSFEWLRDLNKFVRQPDVTVFVDTPVETCMERLAARSARTELFHDRSELERVELNYRQSLEVEEFVGRLVTVDGSPPADEVFGAVVEALAPWLESVGVGTAEARR